MPNRTERYTHYFQVLIDELREQHNFTNACRAMEGQNYYSFASGSTGIKYTAGFNMPQTVYVRLRIDFGDREENESFFDVLKERESEINAQFDVPLHWERRDDVQKCQINVYREGTIDSDPSALEVFRAWHIENLLKFKAVFTPEIELAREKLKSQLIAEMIWHRYRLACKTLVNSSEVEQCIRASEILNELNEWKRCENAFFNLTHLDEPDINSAGDFKQLNEVQQYLSAFKALSTSGEAKRCLQLIEPFGKLDPETKRLLNSGEFYVLSPEDQISTLGDWFFHCDALMSFQNSEKYEHYSKKYPDVHVPLNILRAGNKIGVIHKNFVEWKLVAGLLTVICESDEGQDLGKIIHIVLQFIMEIPGKEYLSTVFLP